MRNVDAIKKLGPLLWLSASNFDGNHPNAQGAVTGVATGRTQDSIGNGVTSSGTINVVNDNGMSAYYFDKSNSITSEAVVNSQYTFVAIFKKLTPSENQGRFFTAHVENRLFASWSIYAGVWHVDEWITSSTQRTADNSIEFYIGTNNNDIKNMWDAKRYSQIVSSSSAGQNVWGKTVIGRPSYAELEAAAVYVYEVLVFNREINNDEREGLTECFKQKYKI